MAAPVDNACISVRGLSKTFGGRTVLRDVDLDVFPGQVHALIGQNGSGKSTLIKILASFHAPDPGGQLRRGGEQVPLPLAPSDPARLGMSFVHQDLALIESATVFENVRVGNYRTRFGWRVSWRAERRLVAASLERFGVAVRADALVSSLTPVDQAQVAIVRAIDRLRGVDHGLLVLDEPTPHLPRDGVDRLFETIRSVAAGGTGVLFVTHRLDEVLEVASDVTVLRDGAVVGRTPTKEMDADRLAQLLLGFSLEALASSEARPQGSEVALQVRDVAGTRLQALDLDLHAGEIVGVTGLLGMGWEELPYLLFDGRRARSGTVRTKDGTRELARWAPRDAIRAGVVLVPADRLRDSVVAATSVRENLTIPWVGTFFRRGALRHRAERSHAGACCARSTCGRPSPSAGSRR